MPRTSENPEVTLHWHHGTTTELVHSGGTVTSMNKSLNLPSHLHPPTVPVIATLAWTAGDEWATLAYRIHGCPPSFAGFVHLGAEFVLRQMNARNLDPDAVHRLAFDAAITKPHLEPQS